MISIYSTVSVISITQTFFIISATYDQNEGFQNNLIIKDDGSNRKILLKVLYDIYFINNNVLLLIIYRKQLFQMSCN